MSSRRHYTNAPITEAVVDLQADLPSDVSEDTLVALHETLKTEFPQSNRRMLRNFTMEFTGEPKSSVSESLNGLQLLDELGTRVMQARLDGFSFSRLAPFDSWEDLASDARRLWAAYREHVRPVRVRRAAVRYINRIDLPLPIHEVRDFLPLIPPLPAEIPNELIGFFFQLRVAASAAGVNVIINHALVPPTRPGVASFILDIDVFQVMDFGIDEDLLWRSLDELHRIENNTFEGSITNKIREIIS